MRDSISKREFAEFYLLDAISSMLNRDNSVHSKLIDYRTKLVLSIADFYIENLREICITEALHTERKWPKHIAHGSKRERLRSLGIKNSDVITEAFLYADNDHVLGADRLIAIFEDMSWDEHYGGENWAGIAKTYKELLMARNDIVIDEKGFDADNGYDVYTHSSLKHIRDHIEKKHNISNVSAAIDKVHHLEHNTGSLLNKFAFSMSSWAHKLMNEKSIPASIQLLRRYVDPEIKQVVKDLPIKDVSPDEIERQLGQLILSKEYTAFNNLTKQEIEDTLRTLEEDYKDNKIDHIKYESEKARLIADIKWYRDEMYVYSKALSEYIGSARERRGILREMIEVSKTDKRLLDPHNELLDQLLKDIMSDYITFELLINAPHWHNELIRILAPYYFKLNIKWSRVFSDLVYNSFGKIVAEKELSVATITNLYDNLKTDGYNMDKFERPESSIAPKPMPHADVENFVKVNLGKEITGIPKWFDDYVNTHSSFYAVSKYMPIGTIVGWKHPNKVCFIPSEHWKLNGYPGNNMEFEYTGTDKRPLVYDIAFDQVRLYDAKSVIEYGKPRNYKDFAYVYAGQKLVVNSLLNYSKWKTNEPFGIIIGYAANQDKKGCIYYIPLDGFKKAGYEGTKPQPGEIIYTLDGMSDENVPECGNIKYNDVSIFVAPEHKVVEVAPRKVPKMPPKGSVDAEHFAVKYIGKQIKATYNYGQYLNAHKKWNTELPLGTIIGLDSSKRICFAPSPEFQKAGWSGIINFDSVNYISDHKSDYYYAIELGNIELLTPEDYEDQYHGEVIDTDLSPNQIFALNHAGKEMAARGQVWTKLLSYNAVIGTVVGYKGDLLCYVPSKSMIDAGFKGEDIDDIVYTDTEHVGDKCYTLISAASISLHGHVHNDIDSFCFNNSSRMLKGTGGMWSELINDKGEKWDLSQPIGKMIGFHKIHNTICFVPSKELVSFGFNKGNKCHIGLDTTYADKQPYYQLSSFEHIETFVVSEKTTKLTDGKRYAQDHCGKQVKRRYHIAGWDMQKVVGTIIGYKSSNGSIIWVPTEEYAKAFAPNELPDDAVVLDPNFTKGTLIHSCWSTSLDLVPATKDNWIKHPDGSFSIDYSQNKKKKKRQRDKPWDKPIGVEPIDMPPYVEVQG